jgi:cytochrome b561
MKAALVHTLMLFVAAAMARLGWFMAHNPERAIQFFGFGLDPAFGRRFSSAWSKAAGWFFTVFGCFGVVFYLVLILLDLFRPHP